MGFTVTRCKYRNCVLFIYFILIFFSLSTNAADIHCSDHLNNFLVNMLGGNQGKLLGHGVNVQADLYSESNKILLLSDRPFDISVGDILAQKFPQKEITGTDYGYEGSVAAANYLKLQMDNTKRFPFESDHFDTIVLRRGMCVCNAGKACAGFCATTEEAKFFFREVIRVLDKSNPKSRAILHGSYRVTEEILDTWKRYMSELEAEYPVLVSFHYNDQGRFILTEIVPRM